MRVRTSVSPYVCPCLYAPLCVCVCVCVCQAAIPSCPQSSSQPRGRWAHHDSTLPSSDEPVCVHTHIHTIEHRLVHRPIAYTHTKVAGSSMLLAVPVSVLGQCAQPYLSGLVEHTVSSCVRATVPEGTHTHTHTHAHTHAHAQPHTDEGPL